MGDEEAIFLLRTLIHVGCAPGSMGTLTFNASPSDPIFWTLHQIFEKGTHVLQLSSKYLETYDYTWVDLECHGSKLFDDMPFTGQFAVYHLTMLGP